MRVIDAHFHMWDPALMDYDWLHGDLNRAFGPAQAELTDTEALTDRIFVQADCRPEQSLREVRWVESVAQPTNVIAVIAHASLEAGARGVEPLLNTYARSPFVVGVRRLLQGEPEGFAGGARFREGAKLLAERDLTFDACVLPHQLVDVMALADALPQLSIVLDHLGKPVMTSEPGEAWCAGLFQLAQRPSVSVKLSGLPAQVGGAWTASQMAPYFDACLTAFGPDRLLYGSDWPVSQPLARWRRTVSEWATTRLGREGASKIMGGNARRIYGLHS